MANKKSKYQIEIVYGAPGEHEVNVYMHQHGTGQATEWHGKKLSVCLAKIAKEIVLREAGGEIPKENGTLPAALE